MDFKNMGAKRVCVVTDSVVKNLDAMKQVIEGLTREGVEFTVFDGCRVEPKDSSWVALPHVSKNMLIAVKIGSKKLLILQNLISQMRSSQLEVDLSLIRQSS